MTFTPKDLTYLAELRDVNNVGDAAIMIATKLGRSELAARFSVNKQAHDTLGYLSEKILQERNTLVTELLRYARPRLTTAEYDCVYRSL